MPEAVKPIANSPSTYCFDLNAPETKYVQSNKRCSSFKSARTLMLASVGRSVIFRRSQL